MSRTKRVTDIAGLFALGCSLLYLWRPASYQVFMVANAAFIVSMLYAAFRATPEERARNRSTAWLVPLAMLLASAYVVVTATPEGRLRSMLLGSGLMVFGVLVYFARRRAT